MTLRRRPLVSLLLVVAAASVAACGGSGAASKDEYAAELNGFCSSFLTATRDLQKSGTSLGADADADPRDAAKKLGGAVQTFSDKIGTSLGGLKGIEPPESYAKFNTGLVDGLTEAQTRLDKVATSAKTGDVKSLGNIGQTLGGLDVPNPPKDLEAKATKCAG